MGSFNILKEYGYSDTDPRPTEISVDPYWILMVYRYVAPLTSSKQLLMDRAPFTATDVSFFEKTDFLSQTVPLIITSDCLNVTVTSSKANYTQQLQAVLKPSANNYLAMIIPGDWLMCWMVNGEDRYRSIIERLLSPDVAKPVNEFYDGLKFVGKVQDIRKVLTQSADGLKTTQYNLQGVGFGELDSSIYFDPNLSKEYTDLAQVLASLSIPLTDIYNTAAEDVQSKGGIDINRMLDALITAYLGKGISGPGTQSGGLQIAQGAAIATEEAPYAYVIPENVATALGVRKQSKGRVFCYADILYVLRGIQKYKSNSASFSDVFTPEGKGPSYDPDCNRFDSVVPMVSLFMPTPNIFDGRSIWSLLQDYLNPALNEMYTVLRASHTSRILPTLVVRQTPFTSPYIAQNLKGQTTAFHSLPRWIADPVLIKGLDIGRTDTVRTNYVQVQGVSPTNVSGTDKITQTVMYPAITDMHDMKRHGFRPHMGEVNVAPTDIVSGGPAEWTQIRADFLIGQHMMLNGVCVLEGVTSPIVPGDNFELDGTLYHIESVTHSVGIAGSIKTFATQLQLTHGVNVDAASDYADSLSGEKKTRTTTIEVEKEDTSTTDYTWRGMTSKSPDDSNQDYVGLADKKVINMSTLNGGGNPDIHYFVGKDEDDNTGFDPGRNGS